MSPPLEITKRKSIVAFLKSRGAWCVVTTGIHLAGCPDVLACYRGTFIALEVKREHYGAYGATKKQLYEIGKISLAGGVAAVVVEVHEVAMILLDIDDRQTEGL